MKRTITDSRMIFMIILMMLASCTYSQSIFPVKGSGTPINRDFDVSGFHSIDVSSGFDVILIQGNSESVTITAQENLFEYFTVKVDNGILKIYSRNNIWATQPLKARITYKNIDHLNVSGGGDVTSETPVNVEELGVIISGGGDFSSVINSGEVKCHISGGGDAEIKGDIKDYYLDMSGGGDLKSEVNAGVISCTIGGGGDLFLNSKEKSADAIIDVNGGGDMEIQINTEKLRCTVSGGGDADLSGQAAEFEINLNGGGDVNAGDLITRTTSFNVSGGSDIRVNASQEISGYISGGGDVYYTGNPERVSVDAKGGSEVHKE